MVQGGVSNPRHCFLIQLLINSVQISRHNLSRLTAQAAKVGASEPHGQQRTYSTCTPAHHLLPASQTQIQTDQQHEYKLTHEAESTHTNGELDYWRSKPRDIHTEKKKQLTAQHLATPPNLLLLAGNETDLAKRAEPFSTQESHQSKACECFNPMPKGGSTRRCVMTVPET